MAGTRLARPAVACATVAISLIAASVARAGYYYVNSCSSYGNTASAFQASATAAHLSPSDECMVWSGTAYRSLEINQVFGSVLKTYGAQWMAETPSPAIMIVNVYTPPNSVLVDCNLLSDGFLAQFFWGDGGQWYGSQPIPYMSGCSGGIGFGYGISQAITPSRYFGWTIGCWLKGSCTASTGGALLAVQGVQLLAQENSGPGLLAAGGNNLWYQTGWVRGTWQATLDASDPSGVCNLVTYVNGQAIASWSDPSPDPSSWTQCHGSQLPAQIDTTKYANGPLSLTYSANNPAAVSTFAARGPGSNPVLRQQPRGGECVGSYRCARHVRNAVRDRHRNLGSQRGGRDRLLRRRRAVRLACRPERADTGRRIGRPPSLVLRREQLHRLERSPRSLREADLVAEHP